MVVTEGNEEHIQNIRSSVNCIDSVFVLSN